MERDDPQPGGGEGTQRKAAEGLMRSVHPHDRALVEWVATAKVGERIPEPWRWASNPTQSVILRLINVGVIAIPPAGADEADVVRDAGAAARAWLEERKANPPS